MERCTIMVNGENHTGHIDGDRIYVTLYGILCWYLVKAVVKTGDGFYRYYGHNDHGF